MCHKAFKDEKDQWRQIQRKKDEKQAPYMENVEPSDFNKDLFKT